MSSARAKLTAAKVAVQEAIAAANNTGPPPDVAPSGRRRAMTNSEKTLLSQRRAAAKATESKARASEPRKVRNYNERDE